MYRRPSRPGRRATVDRAERPFDGLLRFAACRLPANQRMEPTEPDVFPSARSLGRRLIRTFCMKAPATELARLKSAFAGRQKPTIWFREDLHPVDLLDATGFVRDIEGGKDRSLLFQS